MRKRIILISAMFLSVTTMAADSSWLLCKGTAILYEHEVNLVVNSFEHRDGVKDSGETKRANDLLLIYGGHLLKGRFNSSESNTANVKLVSYDGPEKYTGVISVDYALQELKLDGSIVFFSGEAPQVFSTTLKCEELN